MRKTIAIGVRPSVVTLLLTGIIAAVSLAGTSARADTLFSTIDPPVYDQGIGDVQWLQPGEFRTMGFSTSTGTFTFDQFTMEHLRWGEPAWDCPLDLPGLKLEVYKQTWDGASIGDPTLVGELVYAEVDPTPTRWPQSPEQLVHTVYVRYRPTAAILLEPHTIYWVKIAVAPDSDCSPYLIFQQYILPFYGLCDWRPVPAAFFIDPNTGEFTRWDNTLASSRVEGTLVGGDYPRCNQPPDISQARASIAVVWPPNGKMVPITIEGITDPEGDEIRVTFGAVLQDEPVLTPGLDTTFPDAIFGDTCVVRAERLSNGNGRVYRINFEVNDVRGGYSAGQVVVSVPHDRGRKSAAIDDGPDYPSWLP